MLKFFRNIRQRLLIKNKLNKYMIYAVGEIVLVVIGILIALWINDWNEEQKGAAIEKKYLTGMLEDFEDNLYSSEGTVEYIEDILPSLIVLLEQSALEGPTISVDSLNACFSRMTDMPAYSSTDRVYNNLLGSGDLKIIKDDELKTLLAEYYQSIFVLNLVQNTHEMELVQSFETYTIEHLDFQSVNSAGTDVWELPEAVEKDRILAVLHTSKLRNIVTLKWNILIDLLGQNQNMKEINIDIVERLKELTKEED